MFRFSTSFGTHLLVYSFVQKNNVFIPSYFSTKKDPVYKEGFADRILFDATSRSLTLYITGT